MTPTCEEVQALYDQLGTQYAVARRLGRSTADIGAYLRELGVVVRPRGRVPMGQKEPITGAQFLPAPKPVPAVKPAAPPIRIRECHEKHLRLNPYFTTFPVPCVKHDLMINACIVCRERYQPQVVRSGSSMGGVVELRSGSV